MALFVLNLMASASGNPSMLKDINSGPADGNPAGFTVFKDTLYFTADDGVKGSELWKSDGTDTGTMLFKDINPGPAAGCNTVSTQGHSTGHALACASGCGSALLARPP